MAKRPRVSTDDSPLTSNPFAALLPDADVPDAAPASPEEATAAPSNAPDPLADLRHRLVVRRQKKGQGGKTVTCIDGLPKGSPAADELASKLKRTLGCSARVRDGVVVAGTSDHQRVATWLRTLGAARVVVGN